MQVDKPAKPTLIRQKKGKIKAKSQFFRTARYGLTLQEHRIVYFAILRGQQLKRPFEPVTISIKEFMALCDLKGKSTYSVLRNISKKLLSRVIEVVYYNDEGTHLMQTNWISEFTYHLKQGTVTVTPNKTLQPFFEGKPYSETEYYFLIKFTSQYAERLYEIIKSFDHKTSADFEVDELRKRLAVPEGQYVNYSMMRKRVLEPAVKDINEYTDLDITMHEKRGARNKVTDVIFTITKRNVPLLYDRVRAGEFDPPLSDEEQQITLEELLAGEDDQTAIEANIVE